MTHVAYVMSRFPKLTETFILSELLAVRRQGIVVSVHPLLRERTDVVHPDAVPVVAEATFLPFLSRAIVRSNLRELRARPGRYLRTLGAVLRGTWGSTNFTVGALGIFPKVVHMAAQLRSSGVDHVHCHFATHPAVAGYVVRRLTGIPFSFTAHGSDLHVDRHMLPQKVAEAAFVVAISEYNRRLILAECPGTDPGKVVVVHCGVDVSVFRPREATRPAGPLTVVCIGTLHEVKGQRHLVDACALLRRRDVDIRCVLVGDGEDRAALEARAAELGIADRVSFEGALPRDDVLRIVTEGDVVVAPSVPTAQGKREGIPVVLMEAMACGLPVVASDLSGIPELVTDGGDGLLVPPGDARALADALATLAADPDLRARLGAQGRRTVEERFNVDRSAGQLAERFRSVNAAASLEQLAPRFAAMRGSLELPPEVSVVVPVNAKADLEVVLTVLGDVAGYAGAARVEVVLVVNNYPPDDPPTAAIAAYERSGIRVVAVPDVFRAGEAVCFSARLPGIRAAGSDRIVLFDADCRIRDVTALIDWYRETLAAGAAVAYTPVAYDELRDLWSVRARIAAHHGSRWVKRNVLGVPTTRGSNYAVDRGALLALHATGGLADDLNVGPAAKAAGKVVRYSGARQLTVVTSGRRFGGGWLKLARYLRYRLLYNVRMLRRPRDGRRSDPYHDRRQR